MQYVENCKGGIRIAEVEQMIIKDKPTADRLIQERKENYKKMSISELSKYKLLKELTFTFAVEDTLQTMERNRVLKLSPLYGIDKIRDTVFVKMDMKSGRAETTRHFWTKYDDKWVKNLNLWEDPRLGTWHFCKVHRGNGSIYGFDINVASNSLYTTEELDVVYLNNYSNFSEGNMRDIRKIRSVEKKLDEEALINMIASEFN